MESVRDTGVAVTAVGVQDSFRHHFVEVMIHRVDPSCSRKLEAFLAQAVVLTGLTVVKDGVELFTAVATMKFGRFGLSDSHEAVVLGVDCWGRRKASAADFEVWTALTEVKYAQYAAMAVVTLRPNPFAVLWD